jgi:hypothetical protein
MVIMRHSKLSLLVLGASLGFVPLALAQVSLDFLGQVSLSDVANKPESDSFLNATPLFVVERSLEQSDINSLLADEALNVNLGVEISPIDGLSIRADAWRIEVDEIPGSGGFSNPSLPMPQFYSDPASNRLLQPFPGSNLESNGFDVGASYVWETNRAGQFTLSTRATYVYDLSQFNNPLAISPFDSSSLVNDSANPDLQSNVTLTWQLGSHIASAGTNYFDSLKDINELDIETINKLVDNIVTLDLQYGYEFWAGKQDRAVISFGVRNVFNENTTQYLHQRSRALDANGRLAYGSIKYRF